LKENRDLMEMANIVIGIPVGTVDKPPLKRRKALKKQINRKKKTKNQIKFLCDLCEDQIAETGIAQHYCKTHKVSDKKVVSKVTELKEKHAKKIKKEIASKGNDPTVTFTNLTFAPSSVSEFKETPFCETFQEVADYNQTKPAEKRNRAFPSIELEDLKCTEAIQSFILYVTKIRLLKAGEKQILYDNVMLKGNEASKFADPMVQQLNKFERFLKLHFNAILEEKGEKPISLTDGTFFLDPKMEALELFEECLRTMRFNWGTIKGNYFALQKFALHYFSKVSVISKDPKDAEDFDLKRNGAAFVAAEFKSKMVEAEVKWTTAPKKHLAEALEEGKLCDWDEFGELLYTIILLHKRAFGKKRAN
jgi:hypothetical protein